MKTRLSYIFPVTAILLFLIFTPVRSGLIPTASGGCKALTPEAKQNILSAEKIACGLANAFLSDPQITVLCNFAKEETIPILNLVSLHRVALAKSHAVGVTEGASRAGACAPASVGASPPVPISPKAGGQTLDAGLRDAK